MLFDLRGKGRRRTVRVIYLSLAVLMGGGLVFFGVGGNVSGGLLNAFDSNGGGSVSNTFEKRVERYEARVRKNPRDAAAWAELARARYQETSTGENYDQGTSSFTDKGVAKLREVENAWDRYVALDPPKPNADVANLMVQAFGPSGLNKLDKAVSAMEIVVDGRPESAALYGQLAYLAYQAGQTRKAELASEKAIALTPKEQRQDMKDQLNQYRQQAAGAGDGYDQNQRVYTDKGKAELGRANAAWQRYLALNPPKPDADTAVKMVQALGDQGLRQYPAAVRAMEIVLDNRPATYQLYAQLAVLAHGAKQTRKATLSADKAVELAPKDQRKAVRDAIKQEQARIDGLATAGQPTGQ